MESDKLLPSSSWGSRGRGVLPSSSKDDIGNNTYNTNDANDYGNSGSSSNLLSRVNRGEPSGRASRAGNGSEKRPTRLIIRQQEGLPIDSLPVVSGVTSAAISRDLVEKAERWKLLANTSSLPEVTPLLASDVDKHEVASIYVKDALAGRQSPACIHDQSSLRALKLVRNKSWNQLLNVCTIIHLAIPMVEMQRCLPCMGPQKLPDEIDSNALHIGWRLTLLGSMWVECMLWLLYTYDIYQVTLSSNSHIPKRIDASSGKGSTKAPARVASLFTLPPWQLARMCMVALLGIGLASNIFAHYVLKLTWHRWSRVTLPFLFISRRTYLKHFVGGMIRVLPRMIPVVFLMSFVVFFYAFLGFLVYRDEPRDPTFLEDLDLFSKPTSSALTFLRIFTSIPFMLDVEQIYGGKKGIQVMGLSYGVIMVIFLGALVPAVANRNFQRQSKESYAWVKEQRKLALIRAYMVLQREDGTVGRDDWVRLMACLRPDCDATHVAALFDAANNAEDTTISPSEENDRDSISKGGFFMLCALGTATFSRAFKERTGRTITTGKRPKGAKGKTARQRLDSALRWSFPGSNFPLSRQLLNVALVVQGYQIVLEGNAPEFRPTWAYPLGGFLIAYFCCFAVLRMIAAGPRAYVRKWRHALGMSLNLIGVAYYLGFWFDGNGWRSFYHILQACRVVILWNLLHRLGATNSEVARRLELVFPAVLRASFVLFSVTYSYAVLAFAMYCSTPLGTEPIDGVADHSLVRRWASYKDVVSFASLAQSFASMTDVIMLSNWPMFMDAASDVGHTNASRFFFYSFKVLTFYVVMPVMLGFIVQSYMAVQLPGANPAGTSMPALSTTPRGNVGRRNTGGGGGDPLGSSRRGCLSEASARRSFTEGGDDPFASSRSGSGFDKKSSSSKRALSDWAERLGAQSRAGTEGGVGDALGSGGGKASTAEHPAKGKDSARYGGSMFGFPSVDGAPNEPEVWAAADPQHRSDRILSSGGNADVEGGGGGDVGVNVDDDDGDDDDDDDDDSSSSEDDEDASAPVVITSHARSISQTFWGAEQAKDQQEGTTQAQASTEMQENLARLESENASLRALVDSMQMDLQMANARLYDELQTPSRDRSPPPGRVPGRRGSPGGVDASGFSGKLLSFVSSENSAPPRMRVGSANSLGGELEAIVETEDEEVGIV